MLRFLTLGICVTYVCCCPAGWESNQGSCYQFNTNTRLPFQEAASKCAESSSHLAYIDSSDEDRFIVNKLKPLVDESPGRDQLTSVWIGGVDDQVEGSWVWYGVDQPIIEYTNWYPGQPDSGSGDHEEDCICLVGNHGYLWQDHNCKEQMFWVCEMVDNSPGGVIG